MLLPVNKSVIQEGKKSVEEDRRFMKRSGVIIFCFQVKFVLL